MKERKSICLDCLYGSQPYGYFPIVCVHGKTSKDMYEEKFKCKHFEPSQDFLQPRQTPFQVITKIIQKS